MPTAGPADRRSPAGVFEALFDFAAFAEKRTHGIAIDVAEGIAIGGKTVYQAGNLRKERFAVLKEKLCPHILVQPGHTGHVGKAAG